ncbi:MAG TPA: proline dehydrogenase family protein [Thermoanaerobaculales bacterium]|nr:proline dehydrogenase family protein [Thermoanaerobaculales bacterium]HQN96096.1 proline dehydrogenase family protein [Thermoanaerobaculales bacterium]HQP43080.1 proline dehydrogenase family protein [Thermoanaerobaculales bacterium]
MSVFDQLVKHGLPLIPKPIVGYFARPYVAGSTLDDAVRAIRALNAEGAMATVDVLGEAVGEPAKADVAVAEYTRLLERIAKEGIDANVSIKPTLVGLNVDEGLCAANVDTVAKTAASLGNFVRIDMEDRTTTDATLRIYRATLAARGNVGTVLQAYMRRTASDIRQMLPIRPNLRICKGIYREPRTVAWKDFDTIRASFIHSVETLLEAGCYVGIATHDPYLVAAGMRTVDHLGLERHQYEFQMLLGVDPELRKIILDAGHRLRVYVPYGRDWYPYSTRRLRENPTVARHVLRAMVRGGD